MTADRTAYLTAATRRRVTGTRDRATATLRRLDHEGTTTINYVTVANAAGVSRALLYRDPKLREEINRLRDHHQSSVPRQPPATNTSPPCAPKSRPSATTTTPYEHASWPSSAKNATPHDHPDPDATPSATCHRPEPPTNTRPQAHASR